MNPNEYMNTGHAIALPNEVPALDTGWNDYEAVNDPASGKKLPNEGHAREDDWDDYEAVNDPASGKKLPNEGHAATLAGTLMEDAGPAVSRTQPICVTETFVRDITDIYGHFAPHDDEYPAMGITVQGSPVFVECIRFPDCAVFRRRVTDEVKREHPAVGALWQEKLRQYDGKCRTSTVHIHPMNFPFLSGTDIANFDSLRLNPDDPSTFDGDHPYPVLLVNLSAAGKLDLLGFWVMNKRAQQVDVQRVRDDFPIVLRAWQQAKQMPFFTEEGRIVRRIGRLVSKEWDVELGVNPRTGGKAIKAVRSDGKKVLVRFTTDAPLGLSVGGMVPAGFRFEGYFDWTRMFNDLADCEEPEPVSAAARDGSRPSGVADAETAPPTADGKGSVDNGKQAESSPADVSRSGFKGDAS